MPDPYIYERLDPSGPTQAKPWIVVQAILQLGLIALVWVLALVPALLAVLGVAAARAAASAWRALSSRAGR